jgi:hypothetical protein
MLYIPQPVSSKGDYSHEENQKRCPIISTPQKKQRLFPLLKFVHQAGDPAKSCHEVGEECSNDKPSEMLDKKRWLKFESYVNLSFLFYVCSHDINP